MKTDIHPTFHDKAKVTCSCGESFTVGSTSESIDVEICSNCHPFFTGDQKIVDTAGRVDKFKKRAASAKSTDDLKAEKKAKAAKKTKSRA